MRIAYLIGIHSHIAQEETIMNLKTSIIETLRKEVVPATGCTEPVAIALAAAKAAELLPSADSKSLDIFISPNVFKNGMGVGIPNCPDTGLDMAAALGLALADSSAGLKLLSDVTPEVLARARKLLADKKVSVHLSDTDEKIYIEARVSTHIQTVKAIIEGRHDFFRHISVDGITLVEDSLTVVDEKDPAEQVYGSTIENLIKTIEKTEFKELEFLLEGLAMNRSVADYGLANRSGLAVGATLNDQVNNGMMAMDVMNLACILTASASDARMAGVNLSVMSSNGSGNNGLTAVLPLAAYQQFFQTEPERMAKALAISHIINCYIKRRIGRLSSMCGCSIAAATGAGAALSWLMDGSMDCINSTIQNMIANVSGMICDGAKEGCALKLSTSASVAVKSALLGGGHCTVPAHNGIIGNTVEETIENLGRLSNEGMQITDQVILKIMSGMVLPSH